MQHYKAKAEDCKQIYNLVQETIRTVYPRYYPKEIVRFFSELHNADNIRQDIENQTVYLFCENDILLGTGTCKNNHITRVFVLPEYQGQGYGSQMMQYLEEWAAVKSDKVCLDASLPACQFYERRGYVTVRHDIWNCENDVVLVYGIMEKKVKENIIVREYEAKDIDDMIAIWNEVVEEGVAFPQEEFLDKTTGREFFEAQSYCGIAVDAESDRCVGLYILHPNNVGRCGHICNASYAVASARRGLHIGEKLVKDCIRQAGRLGFQILQFNAVVASNIHARHLYERLGFQQLGTIPKGFRLKNGSYEDICPYYISCQQESKREQSEHLLSPDMIAKKS